MASPPASDRFRKCLDISKPFNPAPERAERRFPFRRPEPHNSVRQPKRSEEHTSELQSLMRISYAVFCLKKKISITYISSASTLYQNRHILIYTFSLVISPTTS